MSNQEILEKAIQKAIAGGWRPEGKYSQTVAFNVKTNQFETVEPKLGINDIIFSREFAKVLWGEEQLIQEVNNEELTGRTAVLDKSWQYHLQQMVIADDPIEYLGRNI